MDVLIAVGVFMAITVALASVAVHKLRVSNRVGVRGRGTAPLRWLFDPCWSARLHRRLRRVVGSVRPFIPRRTRRSEEPSSLALLAHDVEAHAVALDRDVVSASRAPKSHRRMMLVDLTEQVMSIESLAARVVSLGSAQQQMAEPTREALARMHAQLDALEEAHEEIARLEAQLGLDDRAPRPHTGTDLT